MVTTAEMEIFVTTSIDRASDKIENDYKRVMTEASEKMKQDMAEWKDSAAAAELRAESGRQSAMKELGQALERERESVANRLNAEDMIQSAHRDIANAAMKMGEAGSGVLPALEKSV